MCRLPAFLSGHLAFSNEPYDVEQVASFWRALGIEAHMVEQIADINPWWSAGRLWVNGSLAQDPDSMQKISFVLLYMSKWRRFCDSRWITIGPCCRSLIWCLCVGLEGWVNMTRSDKSATDFHLHGFSRLSGDIRKLAAVAALAAHVPDALLAEALIDDRLAKRARELKQSVVEEAMWVQSLGPFVWSRLAQVVGPGQSARELAHTTVHASLVALAYVNCSVFSVLEGYPWRLADGDIDANLDALAADPGVGLDPTTNKIKHSVQTGMNRERLKAGVSLLQEIPWSTTPVEQAHASAACLQRYHPEYGTSMLAARATLHQCRHLFLTPPEVRKAEKTEARLAALQKKNPFKLRGSNLFLAELIGGCKEAAPKDANMSQTFIRQVMKNHSGYWDGLTFEEQAKYRKQAQDQAAQMSETQQEHNRMTFDIFRMQ